MDMPEHWLSKYLVHASKYLLPQRREQMQMALLTSVLAQVNGNKDSRLADFLIEPKPDAANDADADPDVAEVREAVGFKPRARRYIKG